MVLWGKKLEIDRSTSSRVKLLALSCHTSQGSLEKGKIELLPFPQQRAGNAGAVVSSLAWFGSREAAVTLTFHADLDKLLQSSPVLSSGRPCLPDGVASSAG